MKVGRNNLVLNVLTDAVKHVYALEPIAWENDTITHNDMTILKHEALSGAQFDTLQLKKNIWTALLEKRATVIIKKNTLGRIVICTTDNNQIYPWDLWARLFQWLGPSKVGVWQIYIYASDVKRVLPSPGSNVSAEHINGGYTYACRSDAIIIYRYEECTRVLIHELLHAACTDHHSKAVEYKEAATEAWAELFLVALLSKGKEHKAYQLWKIQDHHIQDLNYTLRTYYNVHHPADYSARYTIMREPIFIGLGIMLDSYTPKQISSSRFTCEELDKYM